MKTLRRGDLVGVLRARQLPHIGMDLSARRALTSPRLDPGGLEAAVNHVRPTVLYFRGTSDATHNGPTVRQQRTNICTAKHAMRVPTAANHSGIRTTRLACTSAQKRVLIPGTVRPVGPVPRRTTELQCTSMVSAGAAQTCLGQADLRRENRLLPRMHHVGVYSGRTKTMSVNECPEIWTELGHCQLCRDQDEITPVWSNDISRNCSDATAENGQIGHRMTRAAPRPVLTKSRARTSKTSAGGAQIRCIGAGRETHA